MNVSKSLGYGVLCVHMSVLDWQIVGEKSLKSFIQSTSRRANFANRSRPRKCGQPLLSHKLKQAHHTCFTKMHATESPINKILVPSSAPIFAQKSLNTAALTRLLYAIWPPSLSISSLIRQQKHLISTD